MWKIFSFRWLLFDERGLFEFGSLEVRGGPDFKWTTPVVVVGSFLLFFAEKIILNVIFLKLFKYSGVFHHWSDSFGDIFQNILLIFGTVAVFSIYSY